MKKAISIDGFNPEILKPGDNVGFIINGHFRIGIVEHGYNYPECDNKKWFVIGLDGKHYYPYTQDTILLNDYVNVRQLVATLTEVK